MLPAGESCVNDSVRRIAWPMLIWPWIWLVQSGEFESSKSVMYESAPELKALMTILASTGPVISTRRHCSAAGTGAIRQSPSRIAFVSARKSGRSPASSRLAQLGPRREQLLAARLEGAMQLGHEGERRLGEDGLEAGKDRRVDRHAGRQVERHGEDFRSEDDGKNESTSARLVPVRVGAAPSSSSGRPKRLTQRVV